MQYTLEAIYLHLKCEIQKFVRVCVSVYIYIYLRHFTVTSDLTRFLLFKKIYMNKTQSQRWCCYVLFSGHHVESV